MGTTNQSTELQKFNITDSAISEMNEKYMTLSIQGVDDREGQKLVHEARMIVKGKRVEVEKVRKSLVEDAVKWQKTVNEEAKRITGLLSPIEEHLQAEESRIEAEKEKIRLEAERKAQEIYNVRFGFLMSKCEFNGETFQIADIAVDSRLLKSYSEVEFDNLKENICRAYDEIQRLKEEQEAIERAEKEEAERLAKIEAEKLRAEREELEKLRAEQERIAKEQAEKEAAIRAEAERIEAEKRAIEEQKKKEIEAKELAERIERERAEAAEKARLAEIQRQKDEAERIEREAEQSRIEAEREEALRPDKEKLMLFANSLNDIYFPEVHNKKATEILANAKDLLSKVQVYVIDNSKKLR